MPTKNPRLNVVLEPVVYDGLKKMARRFGVSLSLLARDLIKEALEMHEDIFWQKEARVRDKSFSYKKSLSHEELWK